MTIDQVIQMLSAPHTSSLVRVTRELAIIVRAQGNEITALRRDLLRAKQECSAIRRGEPEVPK